MSLQRVLIAVHHYPPRRVGGAELLTQRLAQWLSLTGIEVRVVCIEEITRGPVTQIDFADDWDHSVRVRRINLTVAQDTDLALWYDSPLLYEHFDHLLTEWRPDLLHLVSGYLMGTAPLRAAREHNVPAVVLLTDFWFLCPTIQLLRGDGSLCDGPEPVECARCLYDERRAFRWMDRRAPALLQSFWRAAGEHTWLGAPLGLSPRLTALGARRAELVDTLNQADMVIAPTRFLADMHIENEVDAKKIVVKPYALDRDMAAYSTTVPEPQGAVRFGYLGQITPIKGVHILLRAFLQAERMTKQPMQLDIHGKINAESSYITELQQLAAQSPRIKLHGAYDSAQTFALLAGLDAVVVPSLWYENSPLVILEAFAAKRPVIGTRVGGIAEVVCDDVNGLLFERGNVQDLARVLTRVAENPALVTQLAQNIPAPRIVEQDMNEMMAIYERVLAVRT